MKANLVALFTLNNYFNFSSPKKKKKIHWIKANINTQGPHPSLSPLENIDDQTPTYWVKPESLIIIIIIIIAFYSNSFRAIKKQKLLLYIQLKKAAILITHSLYFFLAISLWFLFLFLFLFGFTMAPALSFFLSIYVLLFMPFFLVIYFIKNK